MDDISQLEFKNMDGEMGKAGKASFLAVEEGEGKEVENEILFCSEPFSGSHFSFFHTLKYSLK